MFLIVFSSTCKFIHCTKEDEDYFRKTGELPEGVTDPAAQRRPGPSSSRGPNVNNRPNNYNNNNNSNKPSSIGVERGAIDSIVPVCKDFLKGLCDRGQRGRQQLLAGNLFVFVILILFLLLL